MANEVNIKKNILDSLITFHIKFKYISESSFMNHFRKQKSLNLNQVFYPKLKSGKISLNEPPEESLDAFILHFRQFHLAKDVVSIKYIKNKILREIPAEYQSHVENVKNLIKRFEDNLKKKPPQYECNCKWKKI